MTQHFNVAPWSNALKVVSLLGTALMCGVSYAAYRGIPPPIGFTPRVGLGVALVPLTVLVLSACFIVSGYSVDDTDLHVERLLTSTAVPLLGLRRVWFEPTACKGSLRVFGNGGLFSFSGWFYSRRLGRYRLFATDFAHSVVLEFPGRTVVVSPAAPHAFVEYLHHVIPGVQVGPEEHGA